MGECPFGREHVGPLAREIIQTRQLPQIENLSKAGKGELAEAWAKSKLDAYAVTAVVIERVFEEILADRKKYLPYVSLEKQDGKLALKPYGLRDMRRKPITELNSFSDIHCGIKDTIKLSVYFILEDLKRLPENDEFKPILARYEELLKISQRIPTGFSFEGLLDIEAGINSGTAEIICALVNIIRVWKRDFPGIALTRDIFIIIADQSYPYLAEIAMLHKATLPLAPGESEFFELVPCRDSFRLQLNELGREKMQTPPLEEISRHNQGPTVGCPAMVKFNPTQDSVVRQIYDWYLDLIAQVAKERFEADSNFSMLDLLGKP